MTDQEYTQFKQFIQDLLYKVMTIQDYEIIMNRMNIPNPNKSNSNRWMYKTLCHNINVHNCKNNLAFDTNTRSYWCFSACNVQFNIITLLEKRFSLIGEPKSRFQCVKFICEQLNIPFDFKEEIKKPKTDIYNWQETLGKYTKGYKSKVELKIYDKSILNYFPKLYHQSWIDDHISIEVMEQYNIRYYPYHDSIVIPCIDVSGNLIGIRERFMNPNYEMKYLPLKLLDGTSYEFPVNQTLYGLNYNSNNIERYRKVVIGEAEKFTLQCATYFGDKNISVSLYGKSMSKSKLLQLLKIGINEVILALDFDYEEVGYYNENDEYIFTEEFEKFKKNIYRIGEYFKPFCKVTALISYSGHKKNDSPTDNGKEWYLALYDNREEIY